MNAAAAPTLDRDPPARVKGPFRPRLAGMLLGVLLVAGGAWLVATFLEAPASPEAAATPEPDWARPTVTAAGLPSRLGVRLTQVAVTGDGGLLDVRFQVVDPEKAAAIHDPETPPAVVAEDSGLFLDDLFMGHSHSGEFKTAVSYYLLFQSDGNLVRPGTRVTVLLGDVQVEHVVVR